MDIALFVLIGLLVVAIAIAFYMDWLGLWVSKEEFAKEIARWKEAAPRPEQQIGIGAGERGAMVTVEIEAKDLRVAGS
jgi:hypothetical protein